MSVSFLLAQLDGDDLLADRGLAMAAIDRRAQRSSSWGSSRMLTSWPSRTCTPSRLPPPRTVQALLSHSAPLAGQVVLGPGGGGSDELVGQARRRAANGSADRARLAVLAVELCPPACDVATLVWRSDRALHPRRTYAVLPELVAATVRSAGQICLANRPAQRIRWESAGGLLSFGDAGPWEAAPHSELVLTGIGLDLEHIRRLLDSCTAVRPRAVRPVGRGWWCSGSGPRSG